MTRVLAGDPLEWQRRRPDRGDDRGVRRRSPRASCGHGPPRRAGPPGGAVAGRSHLRPPPPRVRGAGAGSAASHERRPADRAPRGLRGRGRRHPSRSPRSAISLPETFAVDLLGGRVHARYVAVGTDFRFGHNRAGDVEILRTLGHRHGFEVEAVDLVARIDGEVVSSTRIRADIAAGNVVGAATLLGRHFEMRGVVVHGDARGRTIGFPTANIHVPERMAVPADGVYAVWCRFDGHRAPGVVNIGVRPTFAGTHRTVEVHLLDLDEDLYGVELAVEVVDRIRDELRFESVDALVAQLGEDVAEGRRILALVSGSPTATLPLFPSPDIQVFRA